MDDCPTSFATNLPLLPSLIPVTIVTTYADPLLTLVITFGEDMDQTVEPLPAEFVIVVDGVSKTPISFTWDSATQCTITYSEGVLGPTVVRLRYPAGSARFLSLLAERVTPFDFLTTGP